MVAATRQGPRRSAAGATRRSGLPRLCPRRTAPSRSLARAGVRGAAAPPDPQRPALHPRRGRPPLRRKDATAPRSVAPADRRQHDGRERGAGRRRAERSRGFALGTLGEGGGRTAAVRKALSDSLCVVRCRGRMWGGPASGGRAAFAAPAAAAAANAAAARPAAHLRYLPPKRRRRTKKRAPK